MVRPERTAVSRHKFLSGSAHRGSRPAKSRGSAACSDKRVAKLKKMVAGACNHRELTLPPVPI